MPQLVNYLNLFYEVFDCLLSEISFSEFLNCYFGAKPLALKHISIPTAAYEVILCIKGYLIEVYEEIEAALLEAFH
jgi:hypothetical protein